MYAEVPCYGATADIVAIKGEVVIVVEMKTSLSLKLIEQVFNWRTKAHLVFAAVPQRTEITLFARELLRNAGIGLLVLDIDNTYSKEPYCSRITKYERAKLYRGPLTVKWEQHIIPEFKENIAGVQNADIKVSRYKLMMRYIRRLLERNEDGLSIDEIADRVDSYYINPKKGLFNALKKYESDWCEAYKRSGDKTTYFRIRKD